MSAIAAGHGRKKRGFYLFIASIMALTSLLETVIATFSVTAFSLEPNQYLDYGANALIYLTMFFTTMDLIISGIRVRKL